MNTYLNLVKASLASELRKLNLSLSSALKIALVLRVVKIDKVVFNIDMSRAAILLKL